MSTPWCRSCRLLAACTSCVTSSRTQRRRALTCWRHPLKRRVKHPRQELDWYCLSGLKFDSWYISCHNFAAPLHLGDSRWETDRPHLCPLVGGFQPVHQTLRVSIMLELVVMCAMGSIGRASCTEHKAAPFPGCSRNNRHWGQYWRLPKNKNKKGPLILAGSLFAGCCSAFTSFTFFTCLSSSSLLELGRCCFIFADTQCLDLHI